MASGLFVPEYSRRSYEFGQDDKVSFRRNTSADGVAAFTINKQNRVRRNHGHHTDDNMFTHTTF
jgi:hypothetical protein